MKNQKTDFREQKSEILHSQNANQKSQIANQKSQIANQKSQVTSRKSAVGNLQSEIGNHWRDVVGYVMTTHNAFYPTILSCMWEGGRGRGGDDRVGGAWEPCNSFFVGEGGGEGFVMR